MVDADIMITLINDHSIIHTYHEKVSRAYKSKQADSVSVAHKVIHHKTERFICTQQGFQVQRIVFCEGPAFPLTSWLFWLDLLLSLHHKISNSDCILEKGKKNVDKPYKHLQSHVQGHIKMAYRCSKFNAYCLLNCQEQAMLVFSICRRTVTCHQGQGHQNEHDHIL